MNGDRDDLRDRLDTVEGEIADDAAPLFLFPDGDGGYVDMDGDPIPVTETGESPGGLVIPPEVTDEWVGDWGPQ